MRSNPTDAECAVWRVLRGAQVAGFGFRRQYVISPYIVDFICLERRLIIEVDGAQHASRRPYDRRRDAFLTSEGFRVIRFSDREALTEAEAVRQAVLAALMLPPP